MVKMFSICIALFIILPEVQCKNYSITNCSCGLEYSIRERIFGGIEAKEAEFPWQVALFRGKFYFCGGSIINNLYILSAAHCFRTVVGGKIMIVHAQDITIVLGGHRLKKVDLNKKNEKNLDIRHALHAILHHFFDPYTFVNDVSLIRLKEPIEGYSFKILPVCLPPVGESFEDLDAIVSGWGALKSGGSSSKILRKTDVRVLPHSTCSKKLERHYKKEVMICAASPGHDACQGDSGGPLMIKCKANKYIQVGVVSFGIGCGDYNSPGAYSRLNRFLGWIKEHTSDASYCEH